jgi:hypothetical protein
MKKIIGIILLIALVFVGCDLGIGNTGNNIPVIPDPVDSAFWFADIYDALIYRKDNSIMGTIANTQYVCDAINAKWGADTVTPAPGTETQAANCEYLLKTIDMANGSRTSFGTGSYATTQAVDTIAVDAAVQTLWKPEGKFVAITYNSDRAAYSKDGINWTITTMPNSDNWRDVAYGNGIFVAVANKYNTNKAAYSTNGINWTETTLSSNAYWYNVAYGNGIFVAIGTNKQPSYSTDGIIWYNSTNSLPGDNAITWQKVAYGNGMFVAISSNANISDGSNLAAYSTNGINWTGSILPSSTVWRDVAYGNGMFVAVNSRDIAAYSTNGINWMAGNMQVINDLHPNWSNIAYGNGIFVIVGYASNRAAYSTDGINWTITTMPNSGWYDVAYGNGIFVATANNNRMAYSTNGIIWNSVAESSNGSWYCITYSED